MSIQFKNNMTTEDIQKELNNKLLDITKQNEIKNKILYSSNVFSNKSNIFDIKDNTFITLGLFEEIKRDRFIICSIDPKLLEKENTYNLNNFIISELQNFKESISDNFFLKSFIITISNSNNDFEYEFEYWMFKDNIYFNNIQFFINENNYFCLSLFEENNNILIFNDDIIDNIVINIICK